MGEKPENTINLCYENGKYVFILSLSESHLRDLRTRRLMGMHCRNYKTDVLIMHKDNIALYSQDLHRIYNIPDSDMRIHLNVPVSVEMDWPITTRASLSVFIYFEG